MTTTATGHLGGDPLAYCEKLTLAIDDESDDERDACGWTEAQELALLNRVLSNRAMRRRLVHEAERIEAEALAMTDPLFN